MGLSTVWSITHTHSGLNSSKWVLWQCNIWWKPLGHCTRRNLVCIVCVCDTVLIGLDLHCLEAEHKYQFQGEGDPPYICRSKYWCCCTSWLIRENMVYSVRSLVSLGPAITDVLRVWWTFAWSLCCNSMFNGLVLNIRKNVWIILQNSTNFQGLWVQLMGHT